MSKLGLLRAVAIGMTLAFIVTMFANALQPQPLPTKTVLLVYASGQINEKMVSQFQNAFHRINGTGIPDFLILSLNSTGGDYQSVLKMGLLINMVKNAQGFTVFFSGSNSSGSICTSGCFLLSTFGNWNFVYPGTRFGFNHSYSDVAPIFDSISTMVYLNKGLSPGDFQRMMNDSQTQIYGKDSLEMPFISFIANMTWYDNHMIWGYPLKITSVSITGDKISTVTGAQA